MNKEDVIAIIRGILTSTKSSYSVYSLNKDFKEETGINIPTFGYQNFTDFLQSIPHVLEVTGMYPIQQVRLKTVGKSGHILSLVERQKKSSKTKKLYVKKEYFQNILTDDASFCETSLPSCESENNKKEENGIPEDEKENCIIEDKKVNCVTGKEKKNDIQEVEYSILDSTANNSCTSSESCQYFVVSSDISRYCDKILPLSFSHHAKVGEYIEIYVSHINHPHEFYFQLRKNKRKLFKLMEELASFYNDHTESFLLTEDHIKPGRICAALYSNMWHRAEILFEVNQSTVVVQNVDYGTSGKVLKRDLRFLHSDFGFVSRQAISGSLANIVFHQDNLCLTGFATKRFYELAFEKDLVAGVVEIKKEIPWVSLALTLTVGEEVHINDTLVNKGYLNFLMEDTAIESSDKESSSIKNVSDLLVHNLSLTV